MSTKVNASYCYIDEAIQQVRNLHRDFLSINYKDYSVKDALTLQVSALKRGNSAGDRAVCFHLACWCPEFMGKSSDEIMFADLNDELACLTMAREFGFADWRGVESMGADTLDDLFENTVDAVIVGDLDLLEKNLTRKPALINQQSQYGHRANLLHYLGANGVETIRQITPYNAVKVAELLISAGADVNAKANMYGGSSVVSLIETSAHPNNAKVADSLVQCLVTAGAQA